MPTKRYTFRFTDEHIEAMEAYRVQHGLKTRTDAINHALAQVMTGYPSELTKQGTRTDKSS